MFKSSWRKRANVGTGVALSLSSFRKHTFRRREGSGVSFRERLRKEERTRVWLTVVSNRAWCPAREGCWWSILFQFRARSLWCLVFAGLVYVTHRNRDVRHPKNVLTFHMVANREAVAHDKFEGVSVLGEKKAIQELRFALFPHSVIPSLFTVPWHVLCPFLLATFESSALVVRVPKFTIARGAAPRWCV